MDSPATEMLCLEAMGEAWLSPSARTGGQSTTGMEYRQIGPWAMAVKPKSRVELGSAHEVLRREGVAPFEGGVKVTQSAEPPWYVTRMPGGVGGEGL